MRRQNLAFWCCTFIFIASSSEPRENSKTTNDDEWNNSRVRYEIYANVTMTNHSNDAELIRHNLRENSSKNNDEQYEFHANSMSNDKDNDLVQYEFHAHSAKDHEDGNQMPMELRANSAKTDNKNKSTLHENLMQVGDISNLTNLYELSGKFYEDDNKKNVVPHEMCENSTCILLCCPLGSRLIKDECGITGKTNYPFPDVYVINDSSEKRSIGKKLDQIFPLTIYDPCQFGRYLLNPEENPDDEYMFLVNGSLYQPRINEFVEFYCLAILQKDKYEVTLCFDSEDEIVSEEQNGIPVGLIVSLPFLLATFVVYSILPELRSMHGYTLRGYVGSLFIAYMFLAITQLTQQDIIPDSVCIALGTAYNMNEHSVYTY